MDWFLQVMRDVIRMFHNPDPEEIFTMSAVNKATEFIKEWEGFSATPYRCPAGVLTIGYGETEGVTEHSKPVTEAEAHLMLKRRVREFAEQIDPLIEVELNENQAAALLSFCYNVGVGAFKASTLLRKLNKGDADGAAREFLRWNRTTVNGRKKVLPGLTRRREAEKALFESA